VQTAEGLQTRTGAEATFAFAKAELLEAFAASRGLVELNGLLSDEFTWSDFVDRSDNIDARHTVVLPGYSERGDTPLQAILSSRSSLLLAAQGLHQYEPSTEQWRTGEAYALIGYAELWLAESYCAGVTLSRNLPMSGIEYGKPLTTDSLLVIAQAHFDSAITFAGTNTTIQMLATVGSARAQLDRGHVAEAAAVSAAVPTDYVYDAQTRPDQSGPGQPNVYEYNILNPFTGGCSYINVADQEGTNGLNFLSANDPRLVTDTTIAETCDRRSNPSAPPLYYPIKFGNPSATIPIATGVEARLIEAEGALQANQITTWASDLNTLRSAAPQTYLQLGNAMSPLTSDSTVTASAVQRIAVQFRERAFWLFGTGTRLGDMRRLIKQYGQYGFTPANVYPTGPYANGAAADFPSYSADISLTLPTPNSGAPITNPYYEGCLTSTTAD